jgi:hypothetical protein
MANLNGEMYGLTVLSPIIGDQNDGHSHYASIREYLARMPNGPASPLAKVESTHFARWVVVDDLTYLGKPAKLDHLKSRYLMFTSNFYGKLETYLQSLVREIPDVVEALWSHCAGYTGLADFSAYIGKCQIETTFYFADVNDRTVSQILKALQLQGGLAAFIEESQGKPPEELKASFEEFFSQLKASPPPRPGDPGPYHIHKFGAGQ